MLRNISIPGAILAFVLPFGANVAQAGTTQIVVQWTEGPYALSTGQVFRLQNVFDDHAMQGGYDSDGNDVGSGTQNFYLYTDDGRVDQVVRSVVAMKQQKLLPEGMRIGVAVYKDTARKDWNYRPVYPATLRHFDITYSRNTKP